MCVKCIIYQYNILFGETLSLFHKGEYLALSSYGDYATLPSEHEMLMYAFMRGHMCQFDIVLYPTEKFPGVFTRWFNSFSTIKRMLNELKHCNCDMKPQTYNVAYSSHRTL